MANIYLRVSRYVAAFMRATGDGQSMPPSQPVEFSRYTQEYVTLTDEHDKEMWQRLLDNLDEVDDVQEVYHNVIM